MPELSIVRAVRDALRVALQKDERVVIFGEDVGKKGGVFLATEGLQDEFGSHRVFDTPLAESGIIGTAIGMALNGLRPVAEIQFADFIYPGFNQIVSELATMRYRSGGQMSVPVVIRTPWGGGVKGGLYHSQSNEAHFIHTPGLKVVIPSTPYDAKGLLLASIEDEDPVLFFEPKKIYFSPREEVPEGWYTVPLGVARKVREGTDASLFTYGYMVYVCQEVAEEMEKEGVSLEIIDLRTLLPFDKEAILNSVGKTGRAVIVIEAPKFCSFASEISALIAEEAIDVLQAPIKRVTGYFTPVPYWADGFYIPTPLRVKKAVQEVLKY
ncbi:MAG: alpha-ketoacid dehydrogenase subunit beta [bacterium]